MNGDNTELRELLECVTMTVWKCPETLNAKTMMTMSNIVLR